MQQRKHRSVFQLVFFAGLLLFASGELAIIYHFFPGFLQTFDPLAARGLGYLLAITLCLPLCLALIPLFIMSAWRIRRGGRRAREGRCIQCGYDLRASTDRCPECGAMKPLYPPPSL